MGRAVAFVLCINVTAALNMVEGDIDYFCVSCSTSDEIFQ